MTLNISGHAFHAPRRASQSSRASTMRKSAATLRIPATRRIRRTRPRRAPSPRAAELPSPTLESGLVRQAINRRLPALPCLVPPILSRNRVAAHCWRTRSRISCPPRPAQARKAYLPWRRVRTARLLPVRPSRTRRCTRRLCITATSRQRRRPLSSCTSSTRSR